MRNSISFRLALVVVLPAFLGWGPSLGEGAEPAPGFSLKDVARPGDEQVTLTAQARSEAEGEREAARGELGRSLADAQASLRASAEDLANAAAEQVLGRALS